MEEKDQILMQLLLQEIPLVIPQGYIWTGYKHIIKIDGYSITNFWTTVHLGCKQKSPII